MAAAVPAVPILTGRRFFLLGLCLCLMYFQSGGLLCNASEASADGGMGARRVPDEQRLYETIMRSYQQSVMPHITNTSYSLTVAFSLRLNQIVTLDERKQVLTTNVFIDQTWIDPGLAWDPDNFTDVRALRIPADHVWLPDTFVYNNAAGGTSGFMSGTYVQIQSNGRVLWPVPLRLSSSCSVYIAYFPFDSQICTLRFGSWIYGQRQLDYTPLTDGLTVDPSTYVNNSEWELVSITMKKTVSQPGGPGGLRHLGPHPHLTYVLHLKRNTFYYVFNIIVPCVMLSTLNILTFWLPPVSGEKVTLGLSVFLAFSMFMLLIAETVPATSEDVPLIGAYLCMVMTMTSVSVMMAVVVTNLYHRGRKMRPAPRWLVTVCLRWLAKPFFVHNDIPLISSTVDLVEHCQYDVSHKRRSQPSLAHIHNLNDAAGITPVRCSPSPQNAPLVPTHLQNGGHASQTNHDQDLRRQEDLLDEETGPWAAAASAERKHCSMSSVVNALAEKRVVREVHPRARNSVMKSYHFTKIPTADEDENENNDFVAETPEEEEEVWVKRDDFNRSRSPEFELNRFADEDPNHTHVAKKDDEEEEDEEVEISRSLLANSAEHHSPTDHHHAPGETSSSSRSPGACGGSSSRAPVQLRKKHNCCGLGQKESSAKLDPHPSSSDLQSARTMIAEWQQIATVVDRLMFVVYVLTTLTAYVVILVIIPANQPPVTNLMLNEAGVKEVWVG